MSNHLTRIQPFSGIFALYSIGQISHQQQGLVKVLLMVELGAGYALQGVYPGSISISGRHRQGVVDFHKAVRVEKSVSQSVSRVSQSVSQSVKLS